MSTQPWRIPQQNFSNQPGQWAYKEFEAWASAQEKSGHFKSPSTTRAVIRAFDDAMKAADPTTTLGSLLARNTDLSNGNKSHIISKAQQIWVAKMACIRPISTSSSTTSTIDTSTIASLAARDGFIWFYKAPENTLTACFGNFFEVPGSILGCRTAEGAFQAQKFIGDPYGAFATLDGESAFQMGRSFNGTIKPTWQSGGENVRAMRRVLADKFKPGSVFATALLATGSAYLVEHAPKKGRDSFWTDDFDGTGQNMLGRLLMEQRKALGGTGIVSPPPQYANRAQAL